MGPLLSGRNRFFERNGRGRTNGKGERMAQSCAYNSCGRAASDEQDFSPLLQLRALRFGLLQDGDVGVGVFPKGEEILVGGERADAGGIGIRSLRGSRLQGVCASHSQMRQRSRPAVPDDAVVVENLLELGGGGTAL